MKQAKVIVLAMAVWALLTVMGEPGRLGGTTPSTASEAEIQQLPRSPVPVPGCIVPFVMGDTAGRGALDPDPRNYIDSVDALWILRGIARQHLPGPACSPEDIDCDGDRDAVDALWILRWIEYMPVHQHEPCPDIGTELQ